MKETFKRFTSFLLTLIMVVSMLPLSALAASNPVEPIPGKVNVSISSTAMVNLALNDGIVTAEVEPIKSCSSYTAATAKLTITNKTSNKATISFNCAKNEKVNGDVAVTDAEMDTAGNVTAALDVNGSFTLSFSTKKEAGNAVLTLSNFNIVEEKPVNVTAKAVAAELGSYTVNGEAVTADKVVPTTSATGVSLVVSPAEGYSFAGWYNETTGQYVSFKADVSHLFSDDAVILPKFIPTADGVFAINDARFATLDEALAVANNGSVIRPLKDVTLSKSYTIPKGVTLLVPYEATGICLTDATTNTTGTLAAPSVYRTVTLADGVTLTVNGAVSVSALHYGASGSKDTGGRVSGPYGRLKLNGSSKVDVQSGGTFYAWGYVIGDGEVVANSGATVHEVMQLTEFIGGTNLMNGISNHTKKKFFIFSQYYVQNIETEVTIHSGATLKAMASVTMTGSTMSMPITFIGEGGMFTLTNGAYVTKDYDVSKDRLIINSNGDVSVNSITMSLSGTTVNSSDFYLPVNSNISININSGMATVNQDLTMLPGSEINVAKGAQAYVPAGTQINIYDEDDWGNYVFSGKKVAPLTYIATTGAKSTRGITGDAVVNINGIVTNAGTIYTSAGGAKIISSEGDGIYYNMAAAPTAAITVFGRTDGTCAAGDNNVFNPAWLCNADGTYVKTIGSAAETVYIFNDTKWEVMPDAVVTIDPNGGKGSVITQNIPASVIIQGTQNKYPLPDASEVGFTANEHYTFTGWNTAADGTGVAYKVGDTLTITETITLYAQWTPVSFYLYVDGNDSGYVPFGKDLSEVLPETPTKAGFTFAGWKYFRDENGEKVEITLTENKMPAHDLYVEAQWKPLDFKVTVEGFEDFGGEVAYGTKLADIIGTTVPANPTKEGNKFIGWTIVKTEANEPYTGETMPAYDITYVAEWETLEYTLTIIDVDGYHGSTFEVTYGDAVADVLPEKPTKQGHNFIGWVITKTEDGTVIDPVPTTMPAYDVTFTAQWKEAPKSSAVYVDSNEIAEEYMEGVDLNVLLGARFEGKTVADFNFYSDAACTKPVTLVDGKMPAFDLYAKTLYTISFLDPNGDGTAMEAWTAQAGTSLEDKTVPVIEAPEGKKFVGWSTSGDKEGVIDVRETYKVMPEMDIELMAYFEALLTVKYMVDGEECGDGIADAENKFTIEIDNPTKANYNFTGWLYNGKTYQNGETITLTENAEFEAQFAIKTYEIKWYNDADNLIETTIVEHGGKIVATDATKENSDEFHYVFAGWTKRTGTAIQNLENATATGNAEYKARFTAVSHTMKETARQDATCSATGYVNSKCTADCGYTHTETLAINPNAHKYPAQVTGVWADDGTSCVAVRTCEHNPEHQETAKATIQSEIAKDATCTEPGDTKYTASFNVSWASAEPKVVEGNIPANGHTYVYESDDFVWNGYTACTVEGKCACGETATATAKMSSRETVAATCIAGGKIEHIATFAEEWVTEKAVSKFETTAVNPNNHASEKTYLYNDGDTHSVKRACCNTAVSTGHAHEYENGVCECTAIQKVLVTWFDEAGKNSEKTVDYGTKINEHPNARPKTGYKFIGWDYNGEAVTSDLAINAVYEIQTYTIILDAGEHGSFDGEQTKDYEQEYGTALALIAPTENEGYVLTGWTLNGASVDLSKLETMPAENRTYVAVYGLKDVTLKFNDGTAITEKTGKYFSEIEAPAATKEGHTFQGWAASVNGNVLFSAGGKITLKDTVAEGVQQNTLYAVWQINTFDVTYKNGETTETETYDWSTEITVKSLADTASHTFAGWKNEAGNVYAAGDKITVKSAITLTAQWNIKTYTIKFMVGNEEFDSTTVEHGQVPEIPAGTPTKAENAQFTYTFAGWGNIVAATNDATYNAIFTENLRSYDITFVVDGGEQDKTVTTNYGETPVYGEDPTKPADTMYKYEFAGWNPELKNVTGKATYTAVWNKTPVEYTVTFKIEGEGVWHHVTGGYGTAVDYSKLVTPTKTGHEFTWDVPEAEWPENYPDENVTITGKYTPKTYTITFKGEINNNFEDDSNYIPDHIIKVVYGEVITEEQLEELKNIVPAVTGWEMIGWFLVDDPEAASPYDDAQMYDLTEPMGAGDLTLYAYWDPIPYDLTILSSIDGEEIAYNTMCYGEVYADADEFNHVNGFCYDAECSDEDHAGYRRLNVEGYTFAGYKYEDGSEMKFPIDCWPAEEMTIVAQYVPVDYTIIFMNGETKVGEITAPYGSDITTAVAAINATKEGYVFNCWTAGDKCLELKTMPLNGMTVYATFTNDTFNVNFFGTEGDSTSIISFPVVFDTDLRTEIPDDSETEEDESKPSVLNSLLEQVADPTKEGHTFVEWNINNVPEKMPAGDVNIYGIWNVNSYDINWTVVDENGEEIGKFTETFEFGETITAPEYTAPEGYEIVKIAGTPATMPADTLDRTIEVAPKTYRITFDVEGIDAVVAAYKSEITEWPADPTKPGNTFQGWDKDNDGVADILPGSKVETMPASGLNLKAVWTRNTVYITWNIDGELVTQEYKYGDPIVPPAATRKPTSEWIWEFDQWVDSEGEPAKFDTATNGVEYTATFKTVEARKYAVKFVNGENVVYETEVAWNGQVTLDGFTAPELEGNALKWTVNGAEALFPYAMTTADVTFVANWTPKTYTITADSVIYTFTYNTAVSIPEPTDIGWTFDGWLDAEGNHFDLPAKMPAKDLNLTSSWIVNSYKVFFKDGDSVTEQNVNYSEVIIPVEPDEKGEGYNFAGWFDENGKMLDETYTMPAEEVVFTAKWTYTGWKNDENGTTYLIEDEIAYTNEWKTIDGDDYWFDGAGYIVKDITLIDGNYYAFNHENGHFLSDLTGIYTASNNDLYYVENGIAVKNYGLYKDVDANGHIHYYIFGCGVADCSEEDAGICQGEYKAQKNNCHWVAKTNGHLMIGAYNTGADCVVEHIDDTSVNGIYTIGSTKYCLMDGVKVPAGLVKVGNDFYYARTNGALVVNQKYWVSKTNGLELYGEPIAARIYEFDAEGKMVISTDRNGFYYDSAKGAWYYYVDNAPSYEGLRYFDGTDGVNGTNGGAMGCTEGRPGYYYINTYGMVIAGKSYWVTKNNGLMKSQTYEFDEFGTMKNPAIAKVDGIYAENGKLYYYVNNERCYAGLIKYTGGIHNADGSVTADIYNEDILYVNTSGEVKANCSYWPTKNNGLMPSMTYEFDEYGRMIIEKPEAKKNGIVSEEGKLFYYVDGVRNYAGAIEIDGKYYYVRTSGELAANTTYWVTKNNGLVKSKSYVFDANGVMQDPVLLNQ